VTLAARARWLAKQGARHGVAYGSWACGSLAARAARGTRIRAITYHRFGDVPGDPWCVAPAAFAAQMQWLARNGLAISLDDLCAFVAGRKALAHDAVLVTIDDGCRSTVTDALPILRDAGVPAVVFVSAGLVGAGAVAADHDEPYATWDELAALRAARIEIGSHAFDHRSLGRMGASEARDQAVRSRRRIEAELGVPPRSFAYPFGTRADSNAATDRMLVEVGYEVAFTAVHGAIRPGLAPIGLPRVKVEGGESLRMFELSCRGAMDAWRLVDEVVPRLARARTETRAR
jgi:peptidoglycan/xylan/chitin deacetylase (PgdA/CDA1 family)